jgi:hypothetical protein
MNYRRRNYIIAGLITIIIGYFLLSFIYVFKNQHKTILYADQKEFLIKDSIKIYLDTIPFGYCRNSDGLYWYQIHTQPNQGILCEIKYHVLIWEFKDLATFNIDSIQFNQNVNLDNLAFKRGENLTPNSLPHIFCIPKLSFNNTLKININEDSKISGWIGSICYKGFYGKINKLSISNNNNDNLIIFDNNQESNQALILFYKFYSNFYLIYIMTNGRDNEYPIDENILKILNLENSCS